MSSVDQLICRACGFNADGEEFEAIDLIESKIQYYQRCGNCGSINEQLLPCFEAIYNSDRVSSNYSEGGSKILNKLKEFFLAFTARRYLKTFHQNARVLDFGCGGGELSNAILSMGFKNIAASDVQKKAPNSLNGEIEYVPVSELARSGKFDIIILRHVLEHLENPAETLSSLKKNLSPKGMIVIEVPAAESIFRKILKSRWPGYFCPYHTVIFTQRGLRKLVASQNLFIKDLRAGEPPIFGVFFLLMGWKRKHAKLLSILVYPFQLLFSKICCSSESHIIFLEQK